MNTGRISVSIRINGFSDDALKVINTLRGFPKGFNLKKYPKSEDCEKASPGVVEAHRQARFVVDRIFNAELEIDKDGNLIAIHSKELSSLVKE